MQVLLSNACLRPALNTGKFSVEARAQVRIGVFASLAFAINNSCILLSGSITGKYDFTADSWFSQAVAEALVRYAAAVVVV